MAALAEFPDSEDLARAHLAGVLTAKVTLRREDSHQAGGAVLLWRSGGIRDGLVDAPLLQIEAWHKRDAQAARLASDAVDYLLALGGTVTGGWQITDASQATGIVSLPDPRFNDLSRYVAGIELRVRGVSRQVGKEPKTWA